MKPGARRNNGRLERVVSTGVRLPGKWLKVLIYVVAGALARLNRFASASEEGRIAMARRRKSSVILLLAASGLLGFYASSVGAQGGIEQADTGEPTYLMTVIQIAPLSAEPNLEAKAVGVTLDSAWVGTEFPGYAQCEIRVFNAAGSVLGVRTFEFASYIPTSQHTIDLLVDGVAASGSAACAAAEKPPLSAGYIVSNAEVIGTPDDPRLVFDVVWKTTDPPLLQACKALLRRSDGITQTFDFELSIGNGERGEVMLTPDLASATPMDISCKVFGR